MSITNVSEKVFKRSADSDRRFRTWQTLHMRWCMILQQGMTPHALAIGLAIGATIGILPTVWGTSLVCFGLAWLFRLNHLATQFANYLVYPLQISLFIPFVLLGRQIAPERFANLSFSHWQEIKDNGSGTIDLFLPYQTCATAGWLVTAWPCLAIIYLLVRLFLWMRTHQGQQKQTA